MPATLDQNETQCILRLDGGVDIGLAAELKELLLRGLASSLAAGLEMRVDLTNATDVDIAAFQLLWAAEREARITASKFHIEGRFPEKMAAALDEAAFENLR